MPTTKTTIIVTVSKAETHLEGPAESVIICITDPVEDFPGNWDEDVKARASAWYKAQAEAIVDVLYEHLPGGTFDRVVSLMLDRAASLYTRAYPEMEKTRGG